AAVVVQGFLEIRTEHEAGIGQEGRAADVLPAIQLAFTSEGELTTGKIVAIAQGRVVGKRVRKVLAVVLQGQARGAQVKASPAVMPVQGRAEAVVVAALAVNLAVHEVGAPAVRDIHAGAQRQALVVVAIPVPGQVVTCVNVVAIRLQSRCRDQEVGLAPGTGKAAAQLTGAVLAALGVDTRPQAFASGSRADVDPAAVIRAVGQALRTTQYLNAGDATAEQVFQLRGDLRCARITQAYAIDDRQRAKPFLTAHAQGRGMPR